MSRPGSCQATPESPATGSEAPRLTPEFARRWLECLRAAFGYTIDFPFAQVRTLGMRRCEVCLPLLPYSHIPAALADDIARREPSGADRQVRYITPLQDAAPIGSPVVSAIPLHKWREAAHFWEVGVTATVRKKIRKAIKDGWTTEASADPAAADAFHELFCATMQGHGTPPYPRALFRRALEDGLACIINVRRRDTVSVSYYILNDVNVSLFMWAGFNPHTEAGYASLLGEWEAIRAAFDSKANWFDLGRAPLGGPAWRHKQYWHPQLFLATQCPPPGGNVYARYALAARGWRLLPASLARRLGPWIVGHLSDA